MSKAKKIVKAFLNTAEGYFHTERVLEDQWKQKRDLYGPQGDRPERWDYTDVRDLTKFDLEKICQASFNSIDWELYKQIPSTALQSALQMTIHHLDYGRYQSKIDSKTYLLLLRVLAQRAQEWSLSHGLL